MFCVLLWHCRVFIGIRLTLRSTLSVELKVNKITSSKEPFPKDYYVLPFCREDDGPRPASENLGEFLSGDRIESSPYVLRMRKEMYCEQLCKSNIGKSESRGVQPSRIVRAIRKQYNHNWIVDNLPAAYRLDTNTNSTVTYLQGFPIGFISKQDNKAYVNNHVNIEIWYHPVEAQTDKYRVVRFIVEPFSIKHNFEPNEDSDIEDDSYLGQKYKINHPIKSCDPKVPYSSREHTTYDMVTAADQEPQLASGQVLFTYDVHWKRDDKLHWASRWDIYLNMDDAVSPDVYWVSIANSLVVVIVLTAMVAAILVRNLRRDISRYNRLATEEEKAEDLEEYGWKLVHADVFRPPTFSPLLLSVFMGTGAQILCMTTATIFFAALGFMSPARRGHLVMGQLFLFVCMGAVAGYVSARMYKTFKGKSWQKCTFITAFGFPGLAFFVFILMNIIAAAKGSTDAVPPLTLIILIVLWLGISTPLVFMGAFFGYRQDAIEFPVNTSSIPRQIPDQPWFMGVPFTLMIGGILPFGSCFVALYYILGSVWQSLYFYVFGLLFLILIILLITCAEITVLFNYFMLCSEDYQWWWRAFCNGGAMSIFVFMYSVVYFQTLEANTAATYILYYGYMALVSFGLFLMTGFVGLSTSLYFNKTIFASIKID